jgi:Protein of unknown function (DUF2778)
MSWTYRQSTGALTHNNVLVGSGYSGHGEGLNNPAMEAAQGVGPIPAGDYHIGAPKDPPDHLGPIAMPLTPAPGNAAHGRSAFFMHGDNAAADHTASDGCIIMPRTVRETVCDSDDHDLTVIA